MSSLMGTKWYHDISVPLHVDVKSKFICWPLGCIRAKCGRNNSRNRATAKKLYGKMKAKKNCFAVERKSKVADWKAALAKAKELKKKERDVKAKERQAKEKAAKEKAAKAERSAKEKAAKDRMERDQKAKRERKAKHDEKVSKERTKKEKAAKEAIAKERKKKETAQKERASKREKKTKEATSKEKAAKKKLERDQKKKREQKAKHDERIVKEKTQKEKSAKARARRQKEQSDKERAAKKKRERATKTTLKCTTTTRASNRAGLVDAIPARGYTLTGGGMNNHYRSWNKLSGFEEMYPLDNGSRFRCDTGFGPGRLTCYARSCTTGAGALSCKTVKRSFKGSGVINVGLPRGYTLTGGGLYNHYRSFNKRAGFEESRPHGNAWRGDMGFGWGHYTVYARGCKAPRGFHLQCRTVHTGRGNYHKANCPGGYIVTGCGIRNNYRGFNAKAGVEESGVPHGNGCLCDTGFGTGDNYCYAQCCKLN